MEVQGGVSMSEDFLSEELFHVGVKGMKWGVRKEDREARATARAAKKTARGEQRALKKSTQMEAKRLLKEKAENVLKKQSVLSKEERLMLAWAKSGPTKNALRAISGAVIGTVINDYMTGQTAGYRHMSAGGAIARLAQVGVSAAGSAITLKSASKTYMKGYTQGGGAGKKIMGKTLGSTVKLGLGGAFSAVAGLAARVAVTAADMKMGKVFADRAKNQAKVSSFLGDGKKIWQTPMDNFINIT